MIDTSVEQPKPLSLAARGVTNREGGRGVNISTLFRWAQRGVRGVRLETVVIGGLRMTSDEALQRFYAAVTAVANGEAPQAPTARQRAKAISAAERELEAAGI